jgi:hypothetical protein
MCSVQSIMSPSGVMFGKNQKYADPLGLTNTVIGDPTGRFRKERAKNAKAEALANYKMPTSVPYNTLLANGMQSTVPPGP